MTTLLPPEPLLPLMNEEPWSRAALLLLQNAAHPVAGDLFLEIVGDVLGRLIEDGGVFVVWRKEGKPGGFQVNPLRPGEAVLQHGPINVEADVPPPAGLLPVRAPIEIFGYTNPSGNLRGLYLRGQSSPAELWLLSNRGVGYNPFLDDQRIREGFLAAIGRMQSLLALGAARHRELDRQVDSLCMTRMRDAHGRLRIARDLLRQLVSEPTDCLDLAERLGRLILHETIDAANAASTLIETEENLSKVFARWHQPKEAREKVLCLIRCFRALRSGRLDELPVLEDQTLQLLPLWAEQHRRWSATDRSSPTRDREWAEAIRSSRPLLAAWLITDSEHRRQRPLKTEPMGDLHSVRNSLSLWLCLHLLREPVNGNELRAALAYELRESLRFIHFGERKENLEHLRRIVAAHARMFVSFCDFDALLRAIAGESGINHYAAADHLRHVLDIYMAGHYFLDLQLVRAGSNPVPVAEEMFGPDRAQAGKATFSLAALFHDVDMLFLPDRRPVGTRLLEIMTAGRPHAPPHELRAIVDTIDDLIKDAARSSPVKGAIEELGKLFKKGSQAELGGSLDQWLKHQHHSGLQHGTLGAWFLLRMCTLLEASHGDILLKAVRAVLLHDALNLPVSLATDPVAGLLVLCNEVFVWDPQQRSTEPLDRWISPANVRLTWDAKEQRLIGLLDVVQEEPWPLVRIALKPDMPLRLWQLCLGKAKNLGRLVPKKPNGFSPAVEVIAAIPEILRAQGRTTHWLLERELLHSEMLDVGARNALDAWLKALANEPTDPSLVSEVEEAMTLRWLPDPRPHLENINVAVLNQLQDEWEKEVQRANEAAAVSDQYWELPRSLPLEEEPLQFPPGHRPSLASLRTILQAVLPDITDFDGFCLDCFRAIYQRFSGGMNRTERTNLLLSSEDAVEILRRLFEKNPGRWRQHAAPLLRFEKILEKDISG